MVSQRYEAMLDHLRTAALKNQVGEEFYELDHENMGSSPGTFSFAQEAYHLRVIAALVKVRLAELGEALSHSKPQSWSDGEYKYRVRTITKDTFKVDEDMLKIANKRLYEDLCTEVVDTKRLRQMIDEGRVEGWHVFASFNPGAPYISTGKEPLEQSEAPVVMMSEEAQQ